ncbi:dynamin family protein [Sinirhodobacter sp. WL0062]|uniref:Dynamin family protein n=1 Tax=Rhodobacter flavimaris TaxID=2907145 RepID=A0ABS8YZ93_9RHOB|nr:dynamin family protein [Sinirhodobacter sp. WL0062]MCE5975114.1 dynamin family protein [Sinirhodobacter sp. WL0062]
MTIVPQITTGDRLTSIAPRECLNAGLEPLADFAARVKEVEATLETLEHVAGDAAARSVARLRHELAEFEPAITFLGQVKAGKTTLVNALAGWSDLLPADVNPWTSVVTSLHLMPGTHRKEVGARFQLMKEDEWDRLLNKGGRLGELAQRADAEGELAKIREQIEALREKSRRRLGKKFELLLGQEHEYGYFDKNLLERYICLGDDFLDEDAPEEEEHQGRFADITRAADLYLHCQTMPMQMCLRDTPGVNDTFLMREQVTINAVRESRICVVVLSAHQALTSVDMGLIRLISNLHSRDVVIFVNRIDELRDPAQQVPEIEQSIRDTLARHNGPQDAEIIFGSGYWANKVLSESLDEMSKASSDALVNWAQRELVDSELDLSPAEMVWHLSGLPKLNRAIADQIVTTLGNPKLRKIASAAVTIASGLQAANIVRIEGASADTSVSFNQVTGEFDALVATHMKALHDQLANVTGAYHDRADRAHANFVERATHSLIEHLERNGDHDVWEYDPTGLRVLLKSAYSVYSSRAQTAANTCYKAAVIDVAELLYKSFGNAIEGIQLSIPEAPDPPAPVMLAQTIVLDFNDGWWVSWWRRTRGYKAFATRFYGMISAETADFMAQFKTIPPQDFNAQMEAVLKGLLDQCHDLLFEIGSSRGNKEHLQSLLLNGEERDRREVIDSLLETLQVHVARSSEEALAI